MGAHWPCRNGTEVRFYTIDGGMHCWPGAEFTYPETWCAPGGPHMALAATPLMVSFFLAHPRQGQP